MPRRKKSKKTLVLYILDGSGSMATIESQVRSGYAEYVNTLKKDAEGEVLFSLTVFDTAVDNRIVAKPLSEVEGTLPGVYPMGGMTALYDAVGKAVSSYQLDDDTKVVVVIMTDGAENSSREFNQKPVFDLIKTKEALGNWTFVFLGSDKDAWAQAQRLGVAQGNFMPYAQAATGQTMSAVAYATASATRSAVASTKSYFEDAGQTEKDYTDKPSKLWTPEDPDN